MIKLQPLYIKLYQTIWVQILFINNYFKSFVNIKFNSNLQTDIINTNFSKAYSKFIHFILLKKLEGLDFKVNIYGRSQYIRFNITMSD